MANKKDYLHLTGAVINGKTIIRELTRKNNRPVFEYRCSCGSVNSSLLNSIRKSSKCKSCSYKGVRINRRLKPYESLYNNLLKRNRHPVEITYDEFYSIIKDQECHYCGVDLKMNNYRKKGESTATCLDRKDTLLSYTVSNTVPCCPKCNYGKGKWFSYEEWVKVGEVLKNIYLDNQE